MRALLLCMLVGCYAPTPPQGVPCGVAEDCPSGQRCFDGFCSISAPPPNDGDAMQSEGDAPLSDGPPPMVLTFGERPDAIADTMSDTFLVSGGGDTNNFGQHPDLHLTASSIDPILLRVDLSSVPSDATVARATLIFRVTFNPIADGTKVRVFEMNENWLEGTGDNTAGAPNQFQRMPDATWMSPGAAPPSRESVPASTTTVTGGLAVDDALVINVSTDLVQTWIGGSTKNKGLAVIVEAEDFYSEVGSSEAKDANARPILELEIR